MNGMLPTWLERLFGIHAGPGEGTAWSLEHSWSWPPWLTVLFLLAAVAFVVMVYWRDGPTARRSYRMLLVGIRLAAMAVLLLMIARLAISLQRTGLPYVGVLVDDSRSMTVADDYEPSVRRALESRARQANQGNDRLSRWNLAQMLLTDDNAALLSAIAEDYKLRLYFLTDVHARRESELSELSDEIRSAEPTGETTRLGAAVAAMLDDFRGTVPAALVLLTDGINTDGPPLSEAAVLARRRGVPLYIVGLGNEKPLRDLKLTDLVVDPIVFAGDVVNFDFRLTGAGFANSQVAVVLREQGKAEVLAKTTVTIMPDGQPQSQRLTYRPTQLGPVRFVITAEPQLGELQTSNNHLQRTVEVRKEKIRVLLASASPNYEFRYLQSLLKRDEAVELKTVLQEADVEHAQQDAAALRVFPTRREELLAFDVIILGDFNPALLSAGMLQNLVDFVDQPGKGGSLVLIAGPKFMPTAYRDTPLARLVPVNLNSIRLPQASQPLTEDFQVRPTQLGLATPPLELGDTPAQTQTIWQTLPSLHWLLEAPDIKPGTRVLAEHPTKHGPDGRPLPVICLQYVGAGKVLFHATDETWRWRRRVGDLYFGRYWLQMIRYLSRARLAEAGQSATLTIDRQELSPGEPIRLRLRFTDERLAPADDDGVTVVLERPGYATQRLQLHRTIARGVFDGVLSDPTPGRYHATLAIPILEGRAPSVDFTVNPPANEFERVEMEAPALRQAAQATGGRFYTVENANRLVDDLPQGHQVPIESLPPQPLWNKWPTLCLFLLLLITEWILRKWAAMV